jgi:hypothetical protein
MAMGTMAAAAVHRVRLLAARQLQPARGLAVGPEHYARLGVGPLARC